MLITQSMVRLSAAPRLLVAVSATRRASLAVLVLAFVGT